MLELAAVQIEGAMKDSNASVEVLTESFTAMAGYMRTISDAVQQLPTPRGDHRQAEPDRRLGSRFRHGAPGHHRLQFYDKLVQRLAHVGTSLGSPERSRCRP